MIFSDPQNKGSKFSGKLSEHLFVRKLVPRRKYYVPTSFCRRATQIIPAAPTAPQPAECSATKIGFWAPKTVGLKAEVKIGVLDFDQLLHLAPIYLKVHNPTFASF